MRARVILAVSVSRWAKEQLDAHQKGIIHSIYKNTINLSCGDMLVSLILGNSKLMHPFAVCVEELDTSLYQVGDPFSYSFQNLLIGGSIISLEKAELLNTDLCYSMKGLEENAFSIFWEQAELFAPKSALGFLIKPSLESPLQRWKKDFWTMATSIARGIDFKTESAADSILGLGWGLTPSADDFCIGALAIYFAFVCYQGMSNPVSFSSLAQIAKSRTNQISYNFLFHACYGRFGCPILRLMEALKENDKTHIRQATENVVKIGHSSGTDMLMGAALVAKLKIEG